MRSARESRGDLSGRRFTLWPDELTNVPYIVTVLEVWEGSILPKFPNLWVGAGAWGPGLGAVRECQGLFDFGKVLPPRRTLREHVELRTSKRRDGPWD